jgi:hypothetical protein
VTPSSPDEPLIARLLALPVSERASALERACAEEPALLDRKPELSAALAKAEFSRREDSGARLSPASMVLVLESALEMAPTEAAGTRIGPYKLLQEIGRGGFGVVWMGERLRLDVSQTVADANDVDAELRHLIAALGSPASPG